MDTPRITRVLVTVVATVMVLSALAVLFETPQNNNGQATGNQSLKTVSGVAQYSPSAGSEPLSADTVISLIKENNVPAEYAYLPNLNFVSSGTAAIPTYERSPAPMGVTDYGYSTTSGVQNTYSYTTSGFLGSFMTEGMEPFYLKNNNPGTVAIQLNSVLDHVTVLGSSDYVFWIQNVMLYNPSQGTMQFVDNIWSFTTPSMQFPDNAILSGGGSVVPGLFYYFAGPTISITGTYTAIVYVDSVMNDLNNAVAFSYEITGTESSSTIPKTTYDMVTFNSVLPGTVLPAPAAKFKVSGTETTPAGMLYDSEFVATGPGGGSTTSIYYANDQLKLQYKGTTGTYSNVPAAYSFGANTGETIQGLSIWWTGGAASSAVAHASTGASLLVPLWGSDVTRGGATNLEGAIDPSNAFFFINQGTSFDSSIAAWAPVNLNGTYKYALPGGLDYSGAVMMSEFQPYVFDSSVFAEEETNETESGPPADAGSGGGGGGENETASYFNVSLSFDRSTGIYTPLYANGNDQVKYLTLGSSNFTGVVHVQNITQNMYIGDGTAADPYIIENNQYQQINQIFTRFNDYMFPAFSGVQIVNTDASIQINHPPMFAIKYPTYSLSPLVSNGYPSFNAMNFEFYNTSNIALTGAQSISGWFGQAMAGYPAASVIFWDSTNFLVASNNFRTMSNGLLIYNANGGTGSGTVWGNHFTQDPMAQSPYAPELLNGTDPVGIMMLSSGNLVYNNYFDLGRSAVSPSHDTFTGSPETYSNDWNLDQKYPLSYVNTVLGYALTGSIVETSYQGGNYWTDFDGMIPFTDIGSIAVGGDYYPLIVSEYTVTFTETGLPTGSYWSVTLGDETIGTTGTQIVFSMTNGTYEFRVNKPSSYMASPSSGVAMVYGENIDKNITFSLIQYELSFVQTGHPVGQSWSVDLSGDIKTSTGSTITYLRANGTYAYSISGHQYYQPNPETGLALVNGVNTVENVAFSLNHYAVTFTATGMPEGSTWSVDMNGQTQSTSDPGMVMMVENGTYAYTITAPDGYMAVADSGAVNVYGTEASVEIEFTLQTYNVLFDVKGLPSGTEWGISLGDNSMNTTSSMVEFQMVNGNYTYSVTSVPGYTAVLSSSYVVVNGSDVSVVVQFNQNPNHAATAGLMTGGAAAGIGAGIGIAYLFWRKPH